MWRRYSLSILAGILIGTSYIPFPPWAIFFCFVPLWIHWLKAQNAREVFLAGWLTQFVLTLIGFNWVAHTVHEFGNLPWPAAIVALILFCGFANLHIPVAGLVWFRFFRRQPLALPFLVAAAERLYPMVFDWHLGYTWLWARFPALHLADIVGFAGLSTITIFINYAVLLAVMAWRNQKSRAAVIRPVAVALGLFLILNIVGIWHSSRLPGPEKRLKVLIVQSNVGNDEKAQAKYQEDIRDVIARSFFDLTQKGLAQGLPDFAVWPETAFQEMVTDPTMQSPRLKPLHDFLRANRLPLITGAYSRLEGTGQITNSFFAFNADGVWASPPYHKTMLLAFGEYFPGANLFPKLKSWFPEVGDFGRGQGPTVLSLNDLKIGAQICYEGLFDRFSRSLARQGAQLLVNLTNDSWYDEWMEPRQHGWMTLARAIEVRRPLIRSTNTGISMVILADGTLLERSPLHREWFHLYEIPYSPNPPPTLFMSGGYWFFPLVLLLGLIGLIGRERLFARNQSP